MGCGASKKNKGGSRPGTATGQSQAPADLPASPKAAVTSLAVATAEDAEDPQAARPKKKEEKQELLPLRDKLLPNSMVRELTGAEGTFVVSCYMPKGQTQGTVFAAKAVDKDMVYACDLSDEKLAHRKEEVAMDVDWKYFWRSMVNAFNRSDGMKVEADKQQGLSLEVSMKQGKEAKGAFQVDLESKGAGALMGFRYILEPFLRPPKKQEDGEGEEGGEKEKKKGGVPERDLIRKEAQYSIAEATLAANRSLVAKASELEAMKAKMEEEREKLRESGKLIDQLRRTVAKAHGSTTLDDLYDCLEPPDQHEVKNMDLKEWGWGLDLQKLAAAFPDNALVSVAWSLFEHHGISGHFKLDKKTVCNYWEWMQAQCRPNPYHNAVRTGSMLLWAHHILTDGGMINKLKMSKDEILAAFVACGMTDYGHTGQDSEYLKRTGAFVHTLYSGLLALEQNRLTCSFEILENPRLNFMAPLTVDQRKEIRDTVVEMVFMRANAKACTQREKFEEFKEKLTPSTDWTRPELKHMAMTMLVPMVDFAPWALPREQHLQCIQRLVAEFYAQGDCEKELGIAPGTFAETKWTADRTLHRTDFPQGMVKFIDTTVLPLYQAMTDLLPAVQNQLDQIKVNRAFWDEQGKAHSGKQEHVDRTMQEALVAFPKLFAMSNNCAVLCFAAQNAKGIQFLAATERENCYQCEYERIALEAVKPSMTLVQILETIYQAFENRTVVCTVTGPKCSVAIPGWSSASLSKKTDPITQETLYRAVGSYLRMRTYTKERELDSDVDSVSKKAESLSSKARDIDAEHKKLTATLTAIRSKKHRNAHQEKMLQAELEKVAESAEDKEFVPENRDSRESRLVPDEEGVVRNPLAAPMMPGQTEVPEYRPIDRELFTLIKSKFCAGNAPSDAPWANVMKPLTESEFSKQSKGIPDEKRRVVFSLLEKLDSWDYDVFALQKEMAGGYDHYGLSNQPNGGSLFVTAYSLLFKYDFMKKFNISEQRLINWLSIVEAGYHPNPYHNSMHAADVLHVVHYIMHMGGLIAKCKVPDDEVFAVLLSAAIHDYNHPGINNAFHVKTQNYLAVLFNDRSVNENIHTSSIFELMRMEKYNILHDLPADKAQLLKNNIIELVLGTDMGLHTQFLTRFKKRLEREADGPGLHKTADDRLLALTMALKMSDISNCGRPQKIYHGWCNQIADEFFLQGDREMLLGLTVSPFMDRYTTVMAKGQIAFMNYIVVPLFECMAEWLPKMSIATEHSEQNKAFWQNNEDW